jgi:hypothetical protein
VELVVVKIIKLYLFFFCLLFAVESDSLLYAMEIEKQQIKLSGLLLL